MAWSDPLDGSAYPCYPLLKAYYHWKLLLKESWDCRHPHDISQQFAGRSKFAMFLPFLSCVTESESLYLELKAFSHQYRHIHVPFVFCYFIRSFHIRPWSPARIHDLKCMMICPIFLKLPTYFWISSQFLFRNVSLSFLHSRCIHWFKFWIQLYLLLLVTSPNCSISVKI